MFSIWSRVTASPAHLSHDRFRGREAEVIDMIRRPLFLTNEFPAGRPCRRLRQKAARMLADLLSEAASP